MNGTPTFAFGSFLLIPRRQLLMQDNVAVRIGARALDILTVLVERSGELVTKSELMARVWPSTTVDESNLKVNMSALRKLLVDDAGSARYIATVTGRGYRFIAPIRAGSAPVAENRAPARSGRGREIANGMMRIFEVGDALPAPTVRSYDPPFDLSSHPAAAPGMRFRFVDLPPDSEHIVAGLPSLKDLPGRVDYGIVIDGEVTLMLDDVTVLLKPGSLVVRRGTDHGWANLSGSPCRMLLVEFDGHAMWT